MLSAVDTRYSEVVGGYELSVVKWADRSDNMFWVLWASVGLGILALSDGWLGWGPDATEARWIVRVRDQAHADEALAVRTVRTTLTGWGARHAARQIRRILVSGDAHAIQSLPDLVI